MKSLSDYGFSRVAAASPKISLGNPMANAEIHVALINEIYEQHQAQAIVFPELSLSGYTCGDLFYQNRLYHAVLDALRHLAQNTAHIPSLIMVGAPVRADNQLFNCAVAMQGGEILGVIPKVFMPNYNEFYEKRWFSSAENRHSDTVTLLNRSVPFGENLLFNDSQSGLCIGVEICEDLWVPNPPSSRHVLYGANVIFNLSASNELVGKASYRRSLIEQQSARCIAGYVYASSGEWESTTDVVFSGHCLIAENGARLDECRFKPENAYICQDIDIEKLQHDRQKLNTFMGRVETANYQTLSFTTASLHSATLYRRVNPKPFVPSNKAERSERCQEIIEIQSIGLAQRLLKTGIQRVVLGISGGLDSTLALLVAVEAMKKAQLPLNHIVAVTMPGFGTTDRTYTNALTLMQNLGVYTREISIVKSCVQHFEDIGHNSDIHDVTYENVQARERTQILMDLSNKEGALVIGTGDLSELALGWCTYNGDHMSMYGVNVSIPKTLVRHLVDWYADITENALVHSTLKDILDTPVSPELLPPDEHGEIKQKTEDVVGPYDLHDFFLYQMVRNGFDADKILFLAKIAFETEYDLDTLTKWLNLFIKRFFTQQFKRSCMPDGVKVGSVSLSPRGDWRMPSDASYQGFLLK